VINKPLYKQIVYALGIGILFFISLQLLGLSFQYLGTGILTIISDATSNPFIGLFIGLLFTAILQSSSTTTSMAVAAVAAGSLTLQNAIPIIMGANIGTTLTSTLVSLSYITKAKEFRRALAAGVSHDIFNILVVIILFPIELKYGMLAYVSQQISAFITPDYFNAAVKINPLDFSFLTSWLKDLIFFCGPYITIVGSIGLLLASVKLMSSLLYKRMIGETQERIRTIMFDNTRRSFSWGVLLTSIIQSSSLTTSLIVPLVATRKVKLKRAFPFILGANLGTTLTALLAAVFRSEAAISLAIAHLLFNAIGVSIFLFVPYISSMPIVLAKKLGSITYKYRVVGIAYVLIIFFLLPFTLIYFSMK
jgi:solute carrier family 34 (sodium-dependent phosphate cotransporter)